jgi:hypothetical protein
MEQMRINELDVFFILGNHDLTDPPWLSNYEEAWPKCIHNNGYDIRGVTIGGLNWTPPELLPDMLANMPPTDVVVGHQVWSNFGYGTPETSFEDWPAAELMLVGDYHMWKDVNPQRGPRRVISTGAACRTAINEPDEHYFISVDENLEVTRHVLEHRNVHRVAINNEEGLLRLPEMLERWHTEDGDLRGDLVVKYDPHITDVFSRLEDMTKGKFFTWIDPLAETAYVDEEVDVKVDLALIENGVAGVIANRFEVGSPEYVRTAGLWTAANPEEEYNRYLEQDLAEDTNSD